MSTQIEEALREALAFDPSTPSLPAGPIIATVRRRRQRTVTAAVASSLTLLLAGGIGVVSWQDHTAGTTVPAGATQAGGTFEIGGGWQMVVEDQGLCLTNPDRIIHDCGVNVAFREGSTFSWSHDDPQIYAWVVRDSTATAALQGPQGDAISAQVFRVSELDLSIAVITHLPQQGWTRVSRDASGTVTDEVPLAENEVDFVDRDR